MEFLYLGNSSQKFIYWSQSSRELTLKHDTSLIYISFQSDQLVRLVSAWIQSFFFMFYN